MEKQLKCPRCGGLLMQIPIKRLESVILVELYCEKCDTSITVYPDVRKKKSELSELL